MLFALPLLLAVLAQNDVDSPGDDEALAAPAQADPYGAITVPNLKERDLPAWKDYLLPTPAEAAFETIPWQPTFADGLRRAEAQQKPMLLWVMNGHPLGCT